MIGNEHKTLRQISDLLILNTSCLPDLGLYGGKMGTAIFFAHYARYTQQDVYLDFVYSLVEEVFDELHMSHAYNLDVGLSGIGWAVNYLLSHHFLLGEPNDVLKDLDQALMQYDVRRINDLSLDTGVKGIAFYVFSRLNNQIGGSEQIFDRLFLSDLMNVVSRRDGSCMNSSNLPDFLTGKNIGPDISWSKMPLGLKNGLAGFGLKLMGV